MLGILKGSIRHTDNDFLTIQSLNNLMDTSTTSCLFCDDIDKNIVLSIRATILQRVHVLYFNGIVITDDLMQAQDFINITNSHKRFLYLYHLDWSFIPNLQFSHIRKILLHDHIELIARSDSHAKLIEQMFKPPKYVMPEWDYKTLIEIDNNE